MSDDNFGPWIDWAGGECPIPDAKAGEFELKFRSGETSDEWAVPIVYDWTQIGDFETDIIAYRVRLPADDLLRQAIEALRETLPIAERNEAGEYTRRARAVLTAYDKREQL